MHLEVGEETNCPPVCALCGGGVCCDVGGNGAVWESVWESCSLAEEIVCTDLWVRSEVDICSCTASPELA